jgi:plasmid stabilization system protein ParE
MDNVFEVVALLRKHSELELQILNGHGAAVAAERELQATVRRLAAHPQALNAVLHTAHALRRTPDAVSARDVRNWGCSD